MSKGLIIELVLALLFVLSIGLQPVSARIQMLPGDNEATDQRNKRELLESLSRIVGMGLQFSGDNLIPKALPTQDTPSWNSIAFILPATLDTSDSTYSLAARQLLLSAIESQNFYKVRSTRSVTLGQVEQEKHLIQLNFTDINAIVYRGVPRNVFDVGMIFLHELIHAYIGLTDPSLKEAKQNSNAKGKTVEYMNQIEHELRLPERVHYYPKEFTLGSRVRYSVYFGDTGGRVDLPE
jgi:hypothetical protein